MERTVLPVTGLALPNPASGQYFQTSSPAASGTSSTLGVGTLGLVPWVVYKTFTIDRIGAEVTTVGDAGSKFRLGIYADTGNCYPGTLVLDAGQIAGDSATVQALTISQQLSPGIYWIGGVVQTVATTQPTIRTVANWHPPVPISTGTSVPTAGQNMTGYQQTSVTGALPSTFTTTVSAGATRPRVFARAA